MLWDPNETELGLVYNLSRTVKIYSFVPFTYHFFPYGKKYCFFDYFRLYFTVRENIYRGLAYGTQANQGS